MAKLTVFVSSYAHPARRRGAKRLRRACIPAFLKRPGFVPLRRGNYAALVRFGTLNPEQYWLQGVLFQKHPLLAGFIFRSIW
jgi:hypothetical protein